MKDESKQSDEGEKGSRLALIFLLAVITFAVLGGIAKLIGIF